MNKEQVQQYIEHKRNTTNKFTKPPKEFINSLKELTKHLNVPDSLPVSRLIWHFENDSVIPKCVECKVHKCRWDTDNKRYSKFCSTKCSNKNEGVKRKIKESQNKNGGHPSRRKESVEKRNKTNINRYGTEYPTSNNEIYEKIRETNLKRYGVVNYSQTSEARKNKREWLLQNEDHMRLMHKKSVEYKKTDEYAIKYRNSCIKRLNVKDVDDEESFKKFLKKRHVEEKKTAIEISDEIGIHVSSVCKWLDSLDVDRKYYYTSTEEKEVVQFLEDYDIKIKVNERISLVEKGEVDIVIPEHNVAIEYCGLYWHSDVNKPKNYHRNKFLQCENKGVQLLTIFQDEWLHKKEIVKRTILHKISKSMMPKVYARNTVVNFIEDYTEVKNFFNEYHIQGSQTGSVYIALTDNKDNIVALAAFKKRDEDTVEMVRYATSMPVIGGFSKILKAFERSNKSYKTLVTFADLRWSTGSLYENNGFKLTSEVPPDYYFIRSDARIHKFSMRSISKKFNKNRKYKYSINQVANQLGYHKIYDCGKRKYEKRLGSIQ